MKYLSVALGLLTILCANSAAARAPAACSPSNTVGWVVEVSITSIGRQSSPPVIHTGAGDVAAFAQAPICADTVISNPKGSRRVVTVRFLGERPTTVEEGQDLSAPVSALPGKIKELIDRYLQRSTDAVGTEEASARGSTCPFSAADFQPFSYAAKGWGPIHAAWKCPESYSGLWEIEVSGKDLGAIGTVSARNEFPANIENCGSECMIMVEELGAKKLSYVFLIHEAALPLDKIPAEIVNLPSSAEKRALIGVALTKIDGDYWKLQGYSLILDAACAVPAAALVAKDYYNFRSLEEACRPFGGQ